MSYEMTKDWNRTVPSYQSLYTEETSCLLSAKECCKLFKCSLTTWWRWQQNGIIPKPIKFGRSARWPLSQIKKIIADAENTNSIKK